MHAVSVVHGIKCPIKCIIFEFSIISILFEIKPPIPYKGMHARPLLQFTPIKLENLT